MPKSQQHRMKQMTRERWERIEAVLDVALELEGTERAAWLQTACGPDASLRSDVERLLAAEQRAGAFLETTGGEGNAHALYRALSTEPLEPAIESAAIGAEFGPYRVIEPLGRGGMGAVYIAERADGEFEQRVALKIIRAGLDSDEMMRRFVSERQILARLRHPNIAALLDGGRSSDGRPWFAMELIDGEPITTYCEAHDFTTDRRLEFFTMVCDAVRAAHRANIVHRDLKPSNILVTPDGYVKLLDFGISKQLLDGGIDPRTSVGTRMLTPEHAAPEQLRGGPVSVQTDVYALGTVLYEMLSGERAHRFGSSRFSDYERVVCEIDPEPPSAALERTARLPGAANRAAAMRGDLDAIVLRSLRKEPSERYATVDAMREDIVRFRSGDRTALMPPTWRERVMGAIRRRRQD